MPPRIAFNAVFALAVIAAGAMVPLLGLFGVQSAPPGATQTWLFILASVTLITAIVLIEYTGSAKVPPAVHRLMTVLVFICLLIVWLPQFMGPVAAATGWSWPDRLDEQMLFDIVRHLPRELTLIAPATCAAIALWRYSRNPTSAT